MTQILDAVFEALAWIETRVSSTKQQREGESHEYQTFSCENKATSLHAEVMGVWNTTISGRLEYKDIEERENFEAIKQSIREYNKAHPEDLRQKYYICYAINRFTRAGSMTYEQMQMELDELGVEMVDVQGIIQPSKNSMEDLGVSFKWSKYRPSKTAELFEANRAKDELRDNLTRMIGQAIRNRRQGYAVREVHDGYKNKYVQVSENGKRKKKSVAEYDDKRAKYYIAMGELLEAGYSDTEVVDRVNAMGFLTKTTNRWDKEGKSPIGTKGGKPLTVKRLQEIKQRTALCAVNYDTTWMLGEAVKAKWKGLWTIEQYNKINKGKWFIEELSDGKLKMHKNYKPEARTNDNPLYPFQFLPCPICKDLGVIKPFKGSASRSRNGQHHPAYHCERGHKRLGVSKKEFDRQVRNFLDDLSFDTETWDAFALVLTNKFHEKHAKVSEAAADVGRLVSELKSRKAEAARAFIAANSAGDEEMKTAIQDEIQDLKRQEQNALGQRDKLEVTEKDLEEFIGRVRKVMEHPAYFLLSARNKAAREAYWSLVFEEIPTYHDVIGGTPELSWVFNQKKPLEGDENDLVPSARIELTLSH